MTAVIYRLPNKCGLKLDLWKMVSEYCMSCSDNWVFHFITKIRFIPFPIWFRGDYDLYMHMDNFFIHVHIAINKVTINF